MRGRIAALCALLALLPACGGSAPAPGVGGNRGPVAVDGEAAFGQEGVAPGGGGTATGRAPRVPGTGDVLARYGGPTELVEPAPHEPRDLAVPSLGVESPLLRLGLNPDESLEVPGDFSLAGWYVESPAPGEVGPAVIAGHVDSRHGPAIFYELDQMAPGDEILIRRGDGEVLAFVVERVEQHPKDQFPTEAVYGNTDRPELRLITCGGDFDRSARHYRDNVIVFAALRGAGAPPPTGTPTPAEQGSTQPSHASPGPAQGTPPPESPSPGTDGSGSSGVGATASPTPTPAPTPAERDGWRR